MSRSGRKLPVNPGAPVAGADEVMVPPLLGPVRTGNAFEETVERLLTLIKLGLVAPGDRFPAERELAARLGISRLTLREAIRELQQAGYVESRRGRFGGTFVTYRPPPPSEAEAARLARENAARLTDALTFRMAVETGAAEALARSPAQRASGREVLLARLAASTRPARPTTAAGHALPPVHRGAGRFPAAGRRLRGRQDAAERPAQRHPRTPPQHRSHGPPAHRHRHRDPGRRRGPGPPGGSGAPGRAPGPCCGAS